ncbi:MAG: hypothetical protein QOH68_3405, partial [Nocardioidaceae bacterium]|nr:hypothetical protein [Nocardioidaceae bacterium]
MSDQLPPRLSLLRWILGLGILSTGIHYTHNFVAVDRYPAGAISDEAVQVAILVSWPLLTGIGLYGYRLYAQGRFGPARGCLAGYSVLGLTTLGHFLQGVPQVAPVFFATIFTDFLTGAAVLAFALRSPPALGIGRS